MQRTSILIILSTNRHRSIGARARRLTSRFQRKRARVASHSTTNKRQNLSGRSARQQGFDLPDRDPIKIVELQNAASKFSDRYRTFVSCCMTDNSAPAEIVDLIDEANHILKAVQQKGIFNSAGFGVGSGPGGLGGGSAQGPKLGTFARQFTLSEIVGTVAHARADLFRLKGAWKN